MERISIHCYKHSSKKHHSSLKNQANGILSKLNIANSPQSTTKFYIINNQCVESQKQQISSRKHALSKGISSKRPLSQQIKPHQKSFHHTNPGKTPHPRLHTKWTQITATSKAAVLHSAKITILCQLAKQVRQNFHFLPL